MKKMKTALLDLGEFCSQTFQEYYQGPCYEEDLDAIINGLYKHTKVCPKFDHYQGPLARVRAKQNFLIKQAALLVLGGAASSAWLAIQSGKWHVLGQYAFTGASGAVEVVVVTVTGVVVRRITKAEAAELGLKMAQ